MDKKIENLISMVRKLTARVDKVDKQYTQHKSHVYQRKKNIQSRQNYYQNDFWTRNRSFERQRKTSYRDRSRARKNSNYYRRGHSREMQKDRDQKHTSGHKDMHRDYHKDKYKETNRGKYRDSCKDKNRDNYKDKHKYSYKDKYRDQHKDKSRDKICRSRERCSLSRKEYRGSSRLKSSLRSRRKSSSNVSTINDGIRCDNDHFADDCSKSQESAIDQLIQLYDLQENVLAFKFLTAGLYVNLSSISSQDDIDPLPIASVTEQEKYSIDKTEDYATNIYEKVELKDIVRVDTYINTQDFETMTNDVVDSVP